MDDFEKDGKLRKLQLCELEILNEFVRICEKYRLRYFLAGGTLLGAVRHGGFIPWDDDIDVEMPRKDYELFAQYCAVELGAGFFYQSPKTDSKYFLTYAKLRKKGTFFYEKRFENSEFHKGIFIDIFPLDYAPKPGRIGEFLFNLMAVGNRRGYTDSGGKYVPYQKRRGRICYAFFRVFTPRGMIRLRSLLIALSERLSEKKYLVSYSGAYGYVGELFRADWYSGERTMRFEGREYQIPTRYEMVLKILFGEKYTIIPPENERFIHCELEKVQFEK